MPFGRDLERLARLEVRLDRSARVGNEQRSAQERSAELNRDSNRGIGNAPARGADDVDLVNDSWVETNGDPYVVTIDGELRSVRRKTFDSEVDVVPARWNVSEDGLLPRNVAARPLAVRSQ